MPENWNQSIWGNQQIIYDLLKKVSEMGGPVSFAGITIPGLTWGALLLLIGAGAGISALSAVPGLEVGPSNKELQAAIDGTTAKAEAVLEDDTFVYGAFRK